MHVLHNSLCEFTGNSSRISPSIFRVRIALQNNADLSAAIPCHKLPYRGVVGDSEDTRTRSIRIGQLSFSGYRGERGGCAALLSDRIYSIFFRHISSVQSFPLRNAYLHRTDFLFQCQWHLRLFLVPIDDLCVNVPEMRSHDVPFV